MQSIKDENCLQKTIQIFSEMFWSCKMSLDEVIRDDVLMDRYQIGPSSPVLLAASSEWVQNIFSIALFQHDSTLSSSS